MTIGVFDSGVGGLSVLKELVHIVPEYEYLYLGDNARAPYGDRSPDLLVEFTKQGVTFLFERGCALVILACNSASAESLRRLQQEWLPFAHPDRKLLGILIPTAETIAQKYADKKIGIIGTRATIQSSAYNREITKLCHHAPSIATVACPLLVPLIEEGWQKTVPAKMILKKYLNPLKQKQITLLVLGCTHYSFIKKTIQRIMGKRVIVLDPAVGAARALKHYLAKHPDLERHLSKKNTVRFYSTDSSQRITNLMHRFWNAQISIEHASLE